MTGKTAIVIASSIHAILRVSIFFEQPPDGCSPAPNLGSWLFFISVLLLIRDMDVLPKRYACISRICRIFAEIFIALVLIEFSTIIVWCTMERFIYKLTKIILMENSSNMYYDMGGDALAGVIITILSFFILLNVSLATEFYYDLRFKVVQFYNVYCDGKQRGSSRLPSCLPTELGDSDGSEFCVIRTRRKVTRNCKNASRMKC